MLAPRKRLWSTPRSALTAIRQWIPSLEDGDRICDIGCGDGRILLEWARLVTQAAAADENVRSLLSSVSFVGLDIDADRIAGCEQALAQSQVEGSISSLLSVEFVCANALESTHLLKEVTIVFMYLIPRGLQKITPLLREEWKRRKEQEIVKVSLHSNPNEVTEQGARATNPSQPSTKDAHLASDQGPTPTENLTNDQRIEIRIISYMAKLPGEKVTDRALLTVDHQPGAEWPLYYYEW